MKKSIEGGVVYSNKINVTDDNNKIIGAIALIIVFKTSYYQYFSRFYYINQYLFSSF